MVRKKRKLKKQVYYVLAGFIGLIVLGILGMNYYNDFKYRQTNEYKLLDKGYSNDDTNIMLEKLSENSITMVLNKEKDDERDAFVQSNGYKVLRIKAGKDIPNKKFLLESINDLLNSDKQYLEIVLPEWE